MAKPGELTSISVSDELKATMIKLGFRKENTLAVLMMKVNTEKNEVELEEEWEETTIEEVVEKIPPQQPRFLAFSYPLKHDDGRVWYPRFLVYLSPSGYSSELNVVYDGSRHVVVSEGQFTTVLEFRNIEEITDEVIQAKLKKVGYL